MCSRLSLLGLGFLLLSQPAWADDFSERTVRGGTVTVKLAEPYSQVSAGGSGRYLIFHLKQAKKLVLFDIEKASVIESMNSPSDDVLIAGSAEKLILVTPGTRLIHRYSLPELTREKTTTWNSAPAPRIVRLGCASKGPLILWGDGPVELWDLETLRALDLSGAKVSGDAKYDFKMNVSADGQTFCSWLDGLSSQHFYVNRIVHNELTQTKSPEYLRGKSWVKPNANGTLLIIGGSELSDADLRPIASGNFKGLAMQPTEDPRFFVGVSYPKDPGGEQVWICSTGSLEKIVGISNPGSLRFESSGGMDGYFGNESRMRYLPEAGLLATLPQGNQTIRVMPADLTTLLEEKKADFLHLISVPPREGVAGKQYVYPLELLTNQSPITITIETGPPGMSVDEQGNLKWTPPENKIGKQAQVVISAKSAKGAEVFQSFAIHVEEESSIEPLETSKPSPPTSL